MNFRRLLPLLLFLGAAPSCTTSSGRSSEVAKAPGPRELQSALDPKADEILRRMGKTLKKAQAFRFRATAFYDEVLHTGVEVQLNETVDFRVRRPDGLRLEFARGGSNRILVYDGTHVTLLEQEPALFGTAKAPGNIDATLDMLVETLGLTLPLSDLILSDPYTVLIRSVAAGSYVGTTRIDGVEVHHLVFSQDGLDWQIWIETGERALPVRIVLTYLMAEGAPRYEATLSMWNLASSLTETDFTVAVPSNAEKLEFEQAVRGTE
ncbi:MAG: DUF2092 domain-containing protein [Planctomycetota bacterium]|jgi:hypothetical protein